MYSLAKSILYTFEWLKREIVIYDMHGIICNQQNKF